MPLKILGLIIFMAASSIVFAKEYDCRLLIPGITYSFKMDTEKETWKNLHTEHGVEAGCLVYLPDRERMMCLLRDSIEQASASSEVHSDSIGLSTKLSDGRTYNFHCRVEW